MTTNASTTRASRLATLCGVLGLAATALTGCGTSQWTSSFERESMAPAVSPLSETERGAVKLRKVPWERVQAALDAQRQAEIDSDVPAEQWTDAKRAELRGVLLRQLQVTDAGTVVLGRSRFKSTRSERADEADLAAAAAKIGATGVVWSSRYVGKADRVDRETVFVESWDTQHTYDRSTGRYRQSVFPERATASVPVVRQVDEFEFIAFWLR